MVSKKTDPLWWERHDLHYEHGRLVYAGKDVFNMAQAFGTPSFFYSAHRVRKNLERLHLALGKADLKYRLFYAMKANRHAPVLTFMKTTGLCGIDACSPEEIYLALSCGFAPGDISYTATSVSNSDIEILAHHPEIIVNCDSISMIRRIGEKCPGREIGIRVNPSMGVGYGSVDLLQYSGEKTTKFGIYREQFNEALETARQYKLVVKQIHFHTGCGYLSSQLEQWDKIIKECLVFAAKVEGLRAVNLGGGLGVPHTSGDTALDLDSWANIIRSNFSGMNIEVHIEPGDYIIKDSGILLLEVNTVEKKQSTTFIGVNGGFNIAVEPFFYQLPCEPVLCKIDGNTADVFHPSNLRPVSIAGNINESLDIWIENHPLPEIKEGDFLAMLNSGGYASSMSSNHCMRGSFRDVLLM